MIAISPRTPSVVAAFRPFGGRNALTPFEIASTPVSATAPLAKARTRRNTVTVPAPAATGFGTVACGQAPVAHFQTPVPTSTYMAATNAYVGSAKAIPDSRTPRRLTTVSRTTNARHSPTVCGASAGAAEVSASTPAATDTATVST